jgi:hypothetical protein
LVFPMTEAVKVYRFGEVSSAITVPWDNITGNPQGSQLLKLQLWI